MISFCLVIYYNNEYSLGSGLITVLRNRIGDIGILLRIVYIVIYGRWVLLFIIIEEEFIDFLGLSCCWGL